MGIRGLSARVRRARAVPDWKDDAHDRRPSEPASRSWAGATSSASSSAAAAWPRCTAGATCGSAAPSRSSCCAPTWPRDPSFQARFRREAQSAASLNHPAIVAVYDTGEEPLPTATGGPAQPYIVMEYVEGETLRDIAARPGAGSCPSGRSRSPRASWPRSTTATGTGSSTATSSPATSCSPRPAQVKVMDFGIARAVADSAATMTQTVGGARHRAVPLPGAGARRDRRRPQRRLLHRLPALRAAHRPAAVHRRLARVGRLPARPRARRPAVAARPRPAAGLDAIVMKALAKDPATRYQTAAEMRADLDRLRTGRLAARGVVGVAGAARRHGRTSAIPGRRDPADQPDHPVDDAPAAAAEARLVRPPGSRSASSPVLGLIFFLATQVFGGAGHQGARPGPHRSDQGDRDRDPGPEGAHPRPTITPAESDRPKGTVIAQDPAVNAEVEPGHRRRRHRVRRPGPGHDPDVVGLTQAPRPATRCTDAGAHPRPATPRPRRPARGKDTVFDQRPAGGARRSTPGSAVSLVRVLRQGQGARRHSARARRRPRPTWATPASRSVEIQQEDGSVELRARSSRAEPARAAPSSRWARRSTITVAKAPPPPPPSSSAPRTVAPAHLRRRPARRPTSSSAPPPSP